MSYRILICWCVLSAATAFARPAESVDVDRLPPGSQGEDIVAVYDPAFPARGGNVDWGLALSGGGLRSAAFSIGAMKALYDLGLLDDVDVISSVSGGGYASYWLYSRYDGGSEKRFGDGAFRSDVFARNVCTLGSKSEFFPLRRMIASAFSSRDKAFRKYRDSIEWSFGADHWKSRKEIREAGEAGMRRLRYLLPSINAARAPYFIINTTIKNDKGRKGEELADIEKTFEIGPTYRGSTALGFSEWQSDDTGITAWCNATAMSGAGIRFKLSRKIADYDEPDDKDRIDLADGGLSENLAALPLIVRGVKNIVIVDAENDPGYKFESYVLLKKHLAKKGIELTMRDIDPFLSARKKGKKIFTRTAVDEGTAISNTLWKGAGINSKIYYVKMSRPDSIFRRDARMDQRSDDSDSAESFNSKTRPLSCVAEQLPPITRESMRRDVLSYAGYLNEQWRWGKFIEFLPWINYNFPQITTVDQTFYNDQLRAFIGLGYLEAAEMEAFLTRR